MLTQQCKSLTKKGKLTKDNLGIRGPWKIGEMKRLGNKPVGSRSYCLLTAELLFQMWHTHPSQTFSLRANTALQTLIRHQPQCFLCYALRLRVARGGIPLPPYHYQGLCLLLLPLVHPTKLYVACIYNTVVCISC